MFGDLRVDFFLRFSNFRAWFFGVEGVFLRRGKGITNRGWRVAKGIITDRSRGISSRVLPSGWELVHATEFEHVTGKESGGGGEQWQ